MALARGQQNPANENLTNGGVSPPKLDEEVEEELIRYALAATEAFAGRVRMESGGSKEYTTTTLGEARDA